MELLKEIYDSDVCDDLGSYFERTYKVRKAMRAVLSDGEKIALMHVSKDGYYKLPGGGIDEGEDYVTALKREILEETGCKIKIGEGIGIVVEYRNRFEQIQFSYAYFAEVLGEKGIPDFTQKEKEAGFEVIWVDIDEAIGLLEGISTDIYIQKMMVLRDLIILREAREFLES